MIIDKDISVDNYNFVLSYYKDTTDPKSINEVDCHDLIKISFRPNKRTNENEGNIIFEKYNSYLIEEIRKVITESESFYNNFEVSLRFSGSGHTAVRDINQNILIKMERRLKIGLKE